ncbi:MAG: hypothetical protein KBD52_03200 [Candidatus Pacebacteria bacterium]|nr:hypothetical protein [Candidatus Paceibacterota bacterium]
MTHKMLILSLSLVFVFVLTANTTYAQIKNTDITIDISPTHPAPNQNVKASLNTFVTDLNKAYISWSVNGQKLSSGIGQDTFSFDMDGSTASTQLTINIDTTDGQSISKIVNISPADMDLLWEAYDSYVPPFYKGKTLVSKEGTYKVVAIPSVSSNSGKVNSSNLSYAWKKDYKAQQDASGWGKRFFIYKNSYLDRTNTISVEVSDILGNVSTSKSITLQPTTPKIVFYKKDPTSGINLGMAIEDGHEVSKEGETLIAIPYFISPKNLNSNNLQFNWKIGGEDFYTNVPRNQLGITPEKGVTGSTTISLDVENTTNLFEGAEKQILVNF